MIASFDRLPPLRVVFRDINADLVKAWDWALGRARATGVFAHLQQPVAECGDIFTSPATFLVSPANSFGFMDGGIDWAYSKRFGPGLQENLQQAIRDRHDGELLVGQAQNIATGDPEFPIMVSAPTMRVPMRIVDPIAVYLSTRAAVRSALGAADDVSVIVFPGMGTATGRVPRDIAAQMMVQGVIDAFAPREFPKSWQDVAEHHFQFHEDRR